MTKKEMTEIFSVMMLAWPNAEMFRGGIAKLAPTIELWAVCLTDVDFWTAQQAVVKLCRECKFPPAIAEFKEKATDVTEGIEASIRNSFQMIRSGEGLYGSLDAFCSSLPEDNPTKKAIEIMGGVEALVITDGNCSRWNVDGFKRAYWSMVKGSPMLGGGTKSLLPGLPERRKEST